jgi:hypothetical protein
MGLIVLQLGRSDHSDGSDMSIFVSGAKDLGILTHLPGLGLPIVL